MSSHRPRRERVDILAFALVVGLIAASIVAAHLVTGRTAGTAPDVPPGAATRAAPATAPRVAPAASPISAQTSDADGSPPAATARPGVSSGVATAPTTPVAPTGTAISEPSPNPREPLAVVATYSAGQSLCDLAADQAGRHLYVADDGAERLLVLDAQTGRQTGQVDLGDSLCSIALDERGQTVYAPTWHRTGPGKYDQSRVRAVDLAAGTVRDFADDQFPSGPYFDAASRRLYVGDTAQPRLWVLDTQSGAPTAWPVGAHVNRVAASSKSGHLYLASPQDDKVLVVDPGAGKVVKSLSVGQRPWGVATDPTSGGVLVSSELSGGVSLIDPASDQVVRTTPTGGHPRQVAADGEHGRFYVLNAADRTVSAVAADGSLLSTSAALPGAEDPSGLAVAPQAGRVFVVTKTHVFVLQ